MVARKAKTDSNKPQIDRCYNCSNAYLMRSKDTNPIIAQCKITNERYVASTLHVCNNFARNLQEMFINPMIELN